MHWKVQFQCCDFFLKLYWNFSKIFFSFIKASSWSATIFLLFLICKGMVYNIKRKSFHLMHCTRVSLKLIYTAVPWQGTSKTQQVIQVIKPYITKHDRAVHHSHTQPHTHLHTHTHTHTYTHARTHNSRDILHKVIIVTWNQCWQTWESLMIKGGVSRILLKIKI